MNLRSRAVAIDPQRIAARAVFGAMLALLLVLVMLPLGKSIAQTTTEIHFVNPHTTTSLDVSDKGNPYHLNSWVTQVPSNPLVEYELIDADDNATTIGTATRVGTSDTFEFFWTIDDATLPDGPYRLRATLYQQGTGSPTPVATDEEEIVLNNETGGPLPPEPAEDAEGETVEITYPENAGELGVYVAPDDGDAETPTEQSFIMEVQASGDATHVTGYYSTTPRGTDPVFKACGEGFVEVDDTNNAVFECSVAEEDFALNITAVAAVPNDTPAPENELGQSDTYNDSADAHTVDSYFQRAGSLLLEPTQAGDIPLSSCTTFVATVLDQNTRPIANMNVDVHATGPDDNLRFDTGAETTSNSDASKAPDKGTHSSEPAFECAGATSDTNPADSGAAGGTQGEHNDPTGPDRKHVESVDGTDATGGYAFSLRSATAGSTFLTAWADADNDDLYCFSEASEDGSIGWGGPAPTPVAGAVDTNSCSVIAEPSPSPSPTPTATATSTSTPEPTPSDGSPSPDPTVSPQPDDGDRTFTRFAASKRAVRKGGFVRFTAVLSADDASCQNGVAVKLKAKRVGGRFITLKTKVTDTEGQVRFRVQVKRTKIYKAVAPPEGFCERAKSEQKKVRRK